MFSNLATLTELSHAVKIGSLTEEQKNKVTSNGTTAEAGEGKPGKPNDPKNKAADPTATTTIPASYRQPLCPWFTCCY